MTREEAIDVLKHNYPSSCYEDLCTAVDMAIKALEQPEPCEDTISRQMAIDAVSRGCQELRGIFAECEKNLNELPSAQPEWEELLVICDNCGHAIHVKRQ